MSHLSKRDRDALDRHITGNYGEDQLRNEDTDEDISNVDVVDDAVRRRRVYNTVDKLLAVMDPDEFPLCLVLVTGNKNGDLTAHLMMGEKFDDMSQARLDMAAVIVQTLSSNGPNETTIKVADAPV